jgi:hypothetical protein
MTLRSRIRKIERRLRTKSPITIIAPSEKEAGEEIRKILKENLDARIGSVLIVPPAYKSPKAGL